MSARPNDLDARIVALLEEGHSGRGIANVLRIRTAYVHEVRERRGLPAHRPGPVAEDPYDTILRRTERAPGGCLVWQGHSLEMPAIDGRTISAARFMFKRAYGRAPVGKVLPSCGTRFCVASDHLEDRPMRERYAAMAGALGIVTMDQ